MKPKRNWMRFTIDRAHDPGDRFAATQVTLDHAPALAHLMDVAYTGTIDHEGETPEQCLAEMRGTIEGKYGQRIEAASFVSMDGNTAASASLITLWKGHPLLAFSMTAPEHQGKGRAGFLIQKSLFALKHLGYRELYLVVTEGNAPAERLYHKLGFELLGEAIPGRAVIDRALHTPRLTLEPITEQHAEELCELFRDPDLHHFVPFEPGTLEQQRERCARWAKRKSPDGSEVWLNWAGRDKATGKLAAHFQAGIKATNNGMASIGYVVAGQFQRQGIATEGLEAVFAFLREDFSVREVRAWSDTRNTASHQLAKKLGMVQIGLIKDADFFKGATSDEFVFSKVLTP